ncbi:hypothetical protein [Verrucomicrobium spinosum]|uniref:hypothetical protein n=1 Tax=Verrucomicrobium spinosum TaxID=2736 RepID=UPI0009461FB3|nr:hypothetical protein [Verrucomicrobium spinosum]
MEAAGGAHPHCRDDLNLRLSTTTNGTTLHRAEVQAHLREYYTELTVSVDGPAALHDVLRGQAGLHDRLRTGVQALVRQKHLTGHGPLLRANVVLFRETVTAFPALCQSLADWRIEEITCNQLGGLDRPEYYPAHRLLPPQVDWLTARWPGWQQQLADQGVRLLGGAAYLHRLAMTAQGRHLPWQTVNRERAFSS